MENTKRALRIGTCLVFVVWLVAQMWIIVVTAPGIRLIDFQSYRIAADAIAADRSPYSTPEEARRILSQRSLDSAGPSGMTITP